jgi:hypothetical protein
MTPVRRTTLALLGALALVTGVGVMRSANGVAGPVPTVQQGGSPVPHHTGGLK